jgi:enamine deaminase RidA (YjgF/YER057c/UK114 family)
MIERFAGKIVTRSRAVAHDGLVYTVATAADKSPSLYEQTREALTAIDKNLADAGSDKSRILRATVYITDMAQKIEMNRAWDEWVDMANPPQRACIGVALEGNDLVEILVIAAQKK